jgi:hypothetical protein
LAKELTAIHKNAKGREDSFGNGCRISLVSTGPVLVPSAGKEPRNWLPLAVAAGIVLVVAGVAFWSLEHQSARQKGAAAVTRLAMSESGNLAGGKVTYLDGHIANQGPMTVTGITVQVLFRTYAHEVAQNETQPLKLIRMREPYIDLEPVSAAPLKPAGEQDFRLIFDAVSPDWDGAYPEVRILHVETR